MDPGEDAYRILGITETATEAEIKKAYRRLALQHHPDRHRPKDGQPNSSSSNDDDRHQHHVFAKISNAYEILSNPTKRQEYDRARRYGRDYQDTAGDSDEDHHDHDTYGHGMPGGFHGFSTSSRHFPHRGHDDFFADLHDPFEVFERVFRHEFAGMGGMPRSAGDARRNGFGGGGGIPSPFDDPFFQSSPFGMGGSIFGNHGSFMQSMMLNNGFGPSAFMDGGNVMSSTSTSSSFGGFGTNGTSVSTSTTTRIVNGKRETVTERVVRHPDGRVERHVESSDGSVAGDNARLTGDGADARRQLPSSSVSSRPAVLSGNTRPRSSTKSGRSTRDSGSRSHKKQHVVDLTAEVADAAEDAYFDRQGSTGTSSPRRSRGKKTGSSSLKFW